MSGTRTKQHDVKAEAKSTVSEGFEFLHQSIQVTNPSERLELCLKAYDLSLQLLPQAHDETNTLTHRINVLSLHAGALNHRGDLEKKPKFLENAVKIYQMISEMDPNNWTAYHCAATIHIKLQQPEEALKYLGIVVKAHERAVQPCAKASVKATVKSPLPLQLAKVHTSISILYRDAGKLELAKTHAELAVKHGPEYAPGLSALGKCLEEAFRDKEAKQCFEKARNCNPARFEALHGRKAPERPSDATETYASFQAETIYKIKASRSAPSKPLVEKELQSVTQVEEVKPKKDKAKQDKRVFKSVPIENQELALSNRFLTIKNLGRVKVKKLPIVTPKVTAVDVIIKPEMKSTEPLMLAKKTLPRNKNNCCHKVQSFLNKGAFAFLNTASGALKASSRVWQSCEDNYQKYEATAVTYATKLCHYFFKPSYVINKAKQTSKIKEQQIKAGLR